MKQFTTAIEQAVREDDGEPIKEQYAEFELDGRAMKAYYPSESQMIFLMAVTGRGQDNLGRLAGVVNILMESVRGEDKDYLESRLLTSDPKKSLPPEMISEIFEYVSGEWFGFPTKQPSDSAESPQSDGQN